MPQGLWVRVPLPVPKRKDFLSEVLSFWVPPPRGRLHPSVFQMLGASELPLRRGFASGKTLVRRKGAAGQKAGLSVLLLLSRSLKISILTALCTSEQSPLCSSFPNRTHFVGLRFGTGCKSGSFGIYTVSIFHVTADDISFAATFLQKPCRVPSSADDGMR